MGSVKDAYDGYTNAKEKADTVVDGIDTYSQIARNMEIYNNPNASVP